MELPVLETSNSGRAWYAEGLRFTCTQCGNCCTGGPGFVWITEEEILGLADFLHLAKDEVIQRFCRVINGRYSLQENRNARSGEYDCTFLRETPGGTSSPGREGQAMRTCAVYPARPLQCRTWPFWSHTLSSPQAWQFAGRRCHGMNHGRFFKQEQIESLRDAQQWPQHPPTCAAESDAS